MFESRVVAAATGSVSLVTVAPDSNPASPGGATRPAWPSGVPDPTGLGGAAADPNPGLPVDPDPGALTIALAGHTTPGPDADVEAGWDVEAGPDVDVEASLRAHLRDLLVAPPGAMTAAAVEDLLASDLTALDDTTLVDVIAAAHRLTSWATACHLTAIAHLSRRWTHQSLPGSHRGGVDAETAADLAHRAVVTETALACGLSEHAANTRAQAATELTSRLPATHRALRDGALDWPRVQAIVSTTSSLDTATARAVEDAVLPAATSQNVPALRRALAGAVLAVDPAAAAGRHALLRAERRVAFTPLPDGMGEVWAYLPAPDMLTVKTCLDHLSSTSPGDPRTRDQRRADTFVEVFTRAADQAVHTYGHPTGDGGHPTGDGGDPTGDGGDPTGDPAASGPDHPRAARPSPRRAEIVVAIPLSALTHPGRPALAELAGYGPVPTTAVTDLLATGTWRCAAVDDRHHTLHGLGTTTFTPTYRPARPTERHLTLRDRTCTFPGCHRPASRCDLDHSTPHPRGPTCECNLITLCRHHHRLKHLVGFQVRTTAPGNASSHTPAGTLRWTTPTGHHYRRPPVALTPVSTPTGTAVIDEPGTHDPPPF